MAVEKDDIHRGHRGHISGSTTENKGEGEEQMARGRKRIQYFIEIVPYGKPGRVGRPPFDRTTEEDMDRVGIALGHGERPSLWESTGKLFLQPLYGIGPFERKRDGVIARDKLKEERDDLGRVMRGVLREEMEDGLCVFECREAHAKPLNNRKNVYKPRYVPKWKTADMKTAHS